MAKTIEEIKEEVAKIAGYKYWLEVPVQALFKINNILLGYDELIDLVVKKFANSKLEQAAECAEIRKVIEYPNFPKVFVVDFKTKTDSVVGVKEVLINNLDK